MTHGKYYKAKQCNNIHSVNQLSKPK